MTNVELNPRIIEYSDPRAKTMASIDTVIRTDRITNSYGREIEWTLSHRTAGYTPAGSCMRRQEKEVWRVTRFMDGATHGQAFLTLDAAEQFIGRLKDHGDN